MASGDHYTLTLHGRNSVAGYADADNVFVYEQTGGTGGASELMFEWMTNQLPAIVDCLSVAWEFADVQVINLDDPTDFDQTFVGSNGTRTGDPMPSFVAAGFTYARSSRLFNNGSKRLGPISEGDVASGQPVSGYLTLLQAAATLMGQPIIDAGTVSTWVPVIWRRPGTYDSGVVSPPGLFNPINDVRFTAITTQNTRKIGRGS
jgi:hypothetical protein